MFYHLPPLSTKENRPLYFVVTELEKKEIASGDIVIIPAGEKHWHGATEDSEFSHIFVYRSGSQATQLEE